jgi:hypothetical protein
VRDGDIPLSRYESYRKLLAGDEDAFRRGDESGG